jgi:hypothetical protein
MTLIEHVDDLLAEGLQFTFPTKSPLKYKVHQQVMRFEIRDTSVTDLPHPKDTYHSDNDDPSVVGFLDFHYVNKTHVAIDYMSIRQDLRKRGYARKLVDKFYRIELEKETVSWGKMMHAHVGKLMREMQKKYPDVETYGKVFY